MCYCILLQCLYSYHSIGLYLYFTIDDFNSWMRQNQYAVIQLDYSLRNYSFPSYCYHYLYFHILVFAMPIESYQVMMCESLQVSRIKYSLISYSNTIIDSVVVAFKDYVLSYCSVLLYKLIFNNYHN